MGGLQVNSNGNNQAQAAQLAMLQAPPPPPSPGLRNLFAANQLVQGAQNGSLNSRELVSLGNYRQATQEMIDRFGPGPLSADQQRQLDERLASFDATLGQYQRGEYDPAVATDAPLQNPQDVFRSLPSGEDLRNSNAPWDGYSRALHRLRAAPEGVASPRRYGAAAPPPPANAELGQTVNQNFQAWDLDHNGSLSREELTQNMANPQFQGREAAALATLKRNYERISTLAPEAGISHSDWDTFTRGDYSMDPVGQASSMFQGMVEHRPGATRPLQEESFDPSRIQQNLDGSCVLLSTMRGMKSEDLRKMVHDNGDGTYRIDFADGRTTTIPEPTEAQRQYYANGGEGERWPALFELGARQLLAQNPGFQQEGFDPRDAMMLMTGRQTQGVSTLGTSYNDFRAALNEARAAGGPILAGTGREGLHNGLLDKHEYAVLDFDPATNQVTLANPHHRNEYRGPRDGQNDGVFSMPADEFYASFEHLAWGRPEGAAARPLPPPGRPFPVPGPALGFEPSPLPQ